MKWEEAVQIDNELKILAKEYAVTLGLKKEIGEQLVDKYIEIYPDEAVIWGMLDLQEDKSCSIKMGNICVNQKNRLMEAGIELGVSLEIPDSMITIIKLCLIVLIAIVKSIKIELSENESYIVAYLHFCSMYEKGEEEKQFYVNFSKWYKEKTGDNISAERIKKAINNLLKLKSIIIEDGEIRLQEYVWHNKIVNTSYPN